MKEVMTVPLRKEGLNVVQIPEDAPLLGIVVGPGYMPALAFGVDEINVTTVEAEFTVMRANIRAEEDLGEFMGASQEAGGPAFFVFAGGGEEEEGGAKGRKKKAA